MRGREAQALGETAELLATLCFEVCPYRMPSWVKTIRRATHDEDHQGVDIVVEIDAGPPVGLQVKSGWKRAREFKREHPDIPVLVIHPEDSEEYVRVKLLSMLREERSKRLKALDRIAPRERSVPLRVSSQSTLRVSLGERLGSFNRRER